MKHPRKQVTVEGALELPRVLETLEALVAALRTGAVQVQQGDQSIVLGPRGVLGFSLAAGEKGKRQRLALEFTWRKYSAADTDFDLSIKPGPSAAPARVASDYPVAGDGEATEVATVAGEAAGEAHEGESPRRGAQDA